MRKDYRSFNIIMSVNGIRPVDQGDPQTVFKRLFLIDIGHVRPGCRIVGMRIAATAAQYAAYHIFRDLGKADTAFLHLRHLPHLFFQGHLLKKILHPVLKTYIRIMVKRVYLGGIIPVGTGAAANKKTGGKKNQDRICIKFSHVITPTVIVISKNQ